RTVGTTNGEQDGRVDKQHRRLRHNDGDVQLARSDLAPDARSIRNGADCVWFDGDRIASGNASGDWSMEGSATGSMAVHDLCRVLSRHARVGSIAFSVFRFADDRIGDAGLADGADRIGTELRSV